jgi:hypothetical protein
MVTYIHGVALSLLSPQPFCPHCYPLSFPFVPPFTYLAPSSCDRNCPPSYQVACRLTPFAPPFTQSTHPFQIPRTPIAQRLTTTTLGPLRFHYAEQDGPLQVVCHQLTQNSQVERVATCCPLRVGRLTAIFS